MSAYLFSYTVKISAVLFFYNKSMCCKASHNFLNGKRERCEKKPRDVTAHTDFPKPDETWTSLHRFFRAICYDFDSRTAATCNGDFLLRAQLQISPSCRVLNGWPTTAQRSSSSGASERLTSVYTILCERKNPVTRGQGALSLSSCQSLGPVAAHVLIVCWLNAGAYSHMTILSAQLHLSRRFWNSLSNQTPLSCSLPR